MVRALVLSLVVLLLTPGARAQPEETPTETPAAPPPTETRAPPPNPALGERYDGRQPRKTAAQRALWIPRVLLFPLRLLIWGIEPGAKAGVNYEQRHHVYGRLYSAFTSDDGTIGLRPTFQWVSSFRASVGAHFFHDKLLGPGTKFNFDVAGGVDVFMTALRLRPTRIGRPVQVFFDADFIRRNDFVFSGIGNSFPLPPNSTSRFLQNRFDFGGRVELRMPRYLSFNFGGFFGWKRFGFGEAYRNDPPIDQVYCDRMANGACIPNTVNEAQVPGFNTGTQFVRPSAAIVLDLRNDVVRPSAGLLVSAEGDYSHGLGSDHSSYFRFRGAATLNINLWAERHVLVLRGVTQVAFPVDNSVIPFTELPALGGPRDLRGFRVDELRGFSSLVATAEYRWAVLQWIDAAIFTDWGGVFDRNYNGFGASRMQPDLGFGLRLHTRDRFYVRMQVAYGFNDGGVQFWVTGNNLP